MPLDSALRKFIALIKLPGESQKIDRIITCFAERYCACNPSGEYALDHEDTACIIAFSLTMLNVDAHNGACAWCMVLMCGAWCSCARCMVLMCMVRVPGTRAWVHMCMALTCACMALRLVQTTSRRRRR